LGRSRDPNKGQNTGVQDSTSSVSSTAMVCSSFLRWKREWSFMPLPLFMSRSFFLPMGLVVNCATVQSRISQEPVNCRGRPSPRGCKSGTGVANQPCSRLSPWGTHSLCPLCWGRGPQSGSSPDLRCSLLLCDDIVTVLPQANVALLHRRLVLPWARRVSHPLLHCPAGGAVCGLVLYRPK